MRRFAAQTGQTASEYLGVAPDRLRDHRRGRDDRRRRADQVRHGGDRREHRRWARRARVAGHIVDGNVTPDRQRRRRAVRRRGARERQQPVQRRLRRGRRARTTSRPQYGTNPNEADSDGDRVTDAEEIENGLNPSLADSDGDGLSDYNEFEAGTDPLNPDSDSDGNKDGDDDDPLSYDAGLGQVVQGAACGDSTWWGCPDDDDPVRASLAYFTGQILTGLLAVGDVRDFVAAILRGQWGNAAWAAVGVVPYAGDAAKIGKKLHELITKFPGRRAELLRLIPKILPERLHRVAYDAATGGGWSKLADAGVSDTAIRQLADTGNDLRRLADNARLTERSLTDAEATAIWNAAKDPVWATTKRPIAEALGVETALAQLRTNPNIDVLVTGRPVPGRANVGPDIVAIDRSTAG